ncbi:MAG: hypothetical protein Q4D14_01330 [Bacteroidales bacterium]|nr:hypothetical protein [Bacteroidales bacterium]
MTAKIRTLGMLLITFLMIGCSQAIIENNKLDQNLKRSSNDDYYTFSILKIQEGKKEGKWPRQICNNDYNKSCWLWFQGVEAPDTIVNSLNNTSWAYLATTPTEVKLIIPVTF